MNNLFLALGGRKFVMSLIVIAAAVAVDIYSQRGLSANLAGLLGAILASFSIANVAATKAYIGGKAASSDNSGSEEVSGELRYIADKIEAQEKLIEQIAVASNQTQQAIMAAAQMAAKGQQR